MVVVVLRLVGTRQPRSPGSSLAKDRAMLKKSPGPRLTLQPWRQLPGLTSSQPLPSSFPGKQSRELGAAQAAPGGARLP